MSHSSIQSAFNAHNDNVEQCKLKLLRLPIVLEQTGLSRSTLYRLVAACEFPEPVKLTERSRAWLEAEVDAWIAAKVAARCCPRSSL